MRVIRSISVVISGPDGGIELYKVGNSVNGIEIAKIRNASLEYEDHVHSEYLILDEKNKVIANIDNCPVIVEWMEVQEIAK